MTDVPTETLEPQIKRALARRIRTPPWRFGPGTLSGRLRDGLRIEQRAVASLAGLFGFVAWCSRRSGGRSDGTASRQRRMIGIRMALERRRATCSAWAPGRFCGVAVVPCSACLRPVRRGDPFFCPALRGGLGIRRARRGHRVALPSCRVPCDCSLVRRRLCFVYHGNPNGVIVSSFTVISFSYQSSVISFSYEFSASVVSNQWLCD